MLPKRIRISQTTAEALKQIKGRTGLTPNIVCRIGLVLSLEDGPRGGLKDVDQTGSEFNAPTLFGEFGPFLECMLREVHGVLDTKTAAAVIVSHIEDGVARLRKSKSVLELVEYCGLLS